MSVRSMASVFEARGITPTQKLVLLALADHANDDGRSIYPSTETVCKKTNLSERSVRSTIGGLRNAGILVIVKPATANFPNEYAINFSALAAYDRAGVQDVHPSRGAANAPQGCTTCTSGVQDVHPRGAPRAPKPSINHQLTINESRAAKKTQRERDPRSTTPAILLWKGVTGKNPQKALYDLLIRTLGSAPDGPRLAQVYEAWVARGFSPQNVSGILEWYKSGIPAAGPRKAPAPPRRQIAKYKDADGRYLIEFSDGTSEILEEHELANAT